MSGDCGHGWSYHYDGASGPCYKCKEIREAKEAKYAILRRIAERGRVQAVYDYGVAGESIFSQYVDLFQHMLDEIERLTDE